MTCLWIAYVWLTIELRKNYYVVQWAVALCAVPEALDHYIEALDHYIDVYLPGKL